jgi:ABC-type Zn uptake system ZnuABC Zn-binding protein ZnuA
VLPPDRRLRVVATTSDMASLVSAVCGDLVFVRTIVPPKADPESFEPRVSDLALLSGAALVVRVGLGYDFWLEPLLARARCPVVDASAGVPLLEVGGRDPLSHDGHAHGIANPHYWLDPLNAETAAATIVAALLQLMPDAGDILAANFKRFRARLHERLDAWERALAPCRGTAVLAYHNSWPYFARRFHLNIVGFVEPREGVEPSAAHLSSLIVQARGADARAILQKTSEPTSFSRMLSSRLRIPIIVLAPAVASVPQAPDYLELIDYNVAALARGLATIHH